MLSCKRICMPEYGHLFDCVFMRLRFVRRLDGRGIEKSCWMCVDCRDIYLFRSRNIDYLSKNGLSDLSRYNFLKASYLCRYDSEI